MFDANRHSLELRLPEWMRLQPPAIRLILQGRAEAIEAASRYWGAELSRTACRATAHGSRAALWLGPEEYLLIDTASDAADASSASPAAEFARAMGDIPHALVDVSHRQVAFEITGPDAARLLNGACPLDLDIEAFPIDMCTRTVFAKAEIVLWRRRADAFHLEVWRSFGEYVAGTLVEIARDVI